MLVGRWFQGSTTVTKAADSLFWQQEPPSSVFCSDPTSTVSSAALPTLMMHLEEEEASALYTQHLSLVLHFTCTSLVVH